MKASLDKGLVLWKAKLDSQKVGFIQSGDRDHLVKPIFGRQSYDYLRATGNKAIFIHLPWEEHSFDTVFQGDFPQALLKMLGK